MSEYVLSCESTVDVSAETLDEFSIAYIPFHFFIDDEEYADDLGKTVPYDEFYQRMVDGAMTRTAAIGVGEYHEYFRPFLEQGKDILHVSLSSGLSGTYESACTAAQELAGQFPERTIRIVDSLGASAGYGLLMVTLAERRDAGASLQELYEWAEANKLRMHHEFFSTDLTFYIRGGRVKPISGFVGNLLNICPLLDMDAKGTLVPREKIRSKNKVIRRIVDKMEGYADGGTGYAGRVFISNSACIDDARAVAELVKQRFTGIKDSVRISSIGTTIGSHTGPGTVALFFWGSERA